MPLLRCRLAVVWLGLLGSAALIAGCRDSGPTDPASDPTLATRVVQAPAFHRHSHMAVAMPQHFQFRRDLPPVAKGTKYIPSAPAAGEPVPIPGGVFGGLFHVWVPGPPALGFAGVDVEPNTITNFSGFMAMAYLTGPVTASDGNTYDQFHDMRVMRGTFRDSEGRNQHGTFAFI